jgi:hypothetical protein
MQSRNSADEALREVTTIREIIALVYNTLFSNLILCQSSL